MSEIKVNSIKGVGASTAAISIDNSSGTCTANITNNLSNRNKVINGDFSQDQRNNGAEVNPAADGTFYPYILSVQVRQAYKFKIQRIDNDAPEGFKNALKCTVTNAFNPTGGNYFYLKQAIEGHNIIDLDMGKSTAKKISVSFFVKSSVTGTYCVALRNSAYDCSAVGEYTINSANTWERKTIHFLAATSIGTWLTNSEIGLRLEFVLGVGPNYHTSTLLSFQSANRQASSNVTQWINNAGATFLLTGVQLEKGSVSTDYEFCSIADTLAKCQRYYQIMKVTTAMADTTTSLSFTAPLFCKMRANPSIGKTSGSFKFGNMVDTGVTSSNTPSIDSNYYNHYIAITGVIGGFSPNMTVYQLQKHEPSAGNVALITADADV